MNTRQTVEHGARLIFQAGGRVRMEDMPVPELPGPYGIVLRSEYSLVNSGTDLAKLNKLETAVDPTATQSIIPTGTVMGRVVEVGPAVGVMYPAIAPNNWIIAKGPHASHLQLNVLSDDLVAFGEDRPPLHFLLARYANVAAFALRLLKDLYGGSVAVVGLGPLGHMCMRLLGSRGQNHIVGIDRHAYRRTTLANGQLCSWVLGEQLPDSETFDAIVLAAPLNADLGIYFQRLRPRGRLIMLAAPGAATAVDLAGVFSRSLSIDAFHERETGLMQWERPIGDHVETPVAAGIRVLSDLKTDLKWPLDCFVLAEKAESQLSPGLRDKAGRVFSIVSWCD